MVWKETKFELQDVPVATPRLFEWFTITVETSLKLYHGTAAVKCSDLCISSLKCLVISVILF